MFRFLKSIRVPFIKCEGTLYCYAENTLSMWPKWSWTCACANITVTAYTKLVALDVCEKRQYASFCSRVAVWIVEKWLDKSEQRDKWKL